MIVTLLCGLALLVRPEPTYTLRLNLHQGQVIKYKLLVDRDNPKESGEFDSSYTITDVKENLIEMDCRATGLKINGQDRGKDLDAAWGGQVAKLPWTPLSRRTGIATGYDAQNIKPDMVPILNEAGIYLAYFQRQPVKVGDSWPGSTTATGGCTGGRFTLTKIGTDHGKQMAYFDVTRIGFADPANKLVGPMHIIVDMATGLPTVVDYKVRNNDSKRTSHFRQELVSK
jgi:hypothetical protein